MPTYLTGDHVVTQKNFVETMQSIEARAYDQLQLYGDHQLEELLAALLKNSDTQHRYSCSTPIFDALERRRTDGLVAQVLADPNFVLKNYNNAWLGQHAQALGIALQNPNSDLTSLTIYGPIHGGDRYDPDNLVHVARALQNQHCKITYLKIDSYALPADVAVELAIGLESDKRAAHKLKTVSLHLSTAAVNMRRISQALAHPNCAVTELTLTHHAANNEAVSSLAEVLVQPSCKLETVVLRWGRLTDASIISLATAIKSGNCRLTKLYLANCNVITAAGVRALFQACAGPHCTITTMYLRWLENVHITDDIVANLIKCLCDPTCALRDIYLQRTDISVQGRADIIQALQQYGGTVHMDWPLSRLLQLESLAVGSPDRVRQGLQQLRADRQILRDAIRHAEFNGHVTLRFAISIHDYPVVDTIVYRGFVASLLEVFSGVRCAGAVSVTIKLTRDEDDLEGCHVMWALVAELEKQGGAPPLPENLIIDIGADYTTSAVILALMAAVRNENCPHNLTLKTTSLELTEIFKAPATGAVDHRPDLVARNFHLTGSAAIDTADKAFYTAMCGPEAGSLVTMAAVAHEVDVATECVHMLCRVWTIEKPADYYANQTQRGTIPPAATEQPAQHTKTMQRL